ncbi:MAG: DUF1178 family protein [Paracoccaceae bacterium]|nr:DUF1178 family protein [Paracoccaceae bacterium]
MIRYALKCAAGHGFESWFQSGETYDKLAANGLVSCPVCGSPDVAKTLMAPALRPARNAAHSADDAPAPPATGPLSTPATGAEAALAALRREIEKNSDYVGMNFATEARRIHAGNAPERAIHGEAKPDEARQLIEDGVPVAPLPFLPGRKTN